MDLPRDEMAFRKTYEKLLLQKAITTVYRPGTRVYPNRRGYLVGETVMARVIERCGSDELGIAPVFNAIRIPIRISSLTVKTIDDFNDGDFEGSSPDVYDRDSLARHLAGIYRKPIECFGDTVTRIQFRYLDGNVCAEPWFHRSDMRGVSSSAENSSLSN